MTVHPKIRCLGSGALAKTTNRFAPITATDRSGHAGSEKLERAKEHAEAITAFYIHLAVYVVVMTVLLVINILTATVWWVQGPLLGWGIGVLFHVHGLTVFGEVPNLVK